MYMTFSTRKNYGPENKSVVTRGWGREGLSAKGNKKEFFGIVELFYILLVGGVTSNLSTC